MRAPVPAEPVKPLIHLAQCRAVHCVQASLAVGPHRGKAVVAQHLQMLRYRGLSDRELALNRRSDCSSRHLTVGKKFEDATAHRVAEDVERVHIPKIEV